MSAQQNMEGVGHQMNAAGYSEAEQKIDHSTEDISHSAQGHKANISNPSTHAVTYQVEHLRVWVLTRLQIRVRSRRSTPRKNWRSWEGRRLFTGSRDLASRCTRGYSWDEK